MLHEPREELCIAIHGSVRLDPLRGLRSGHGDELSDVHEIYVNMTGSEVGDPLRRTHAERSVAGAEEVFFFLEAMTRTDTTAVPMSTGSTHFGMVTDET